MVELSFGRGEVGGAQKCSGEVSTQAGHSKV